MLKTGEDYEIEFRFKPIGPDLIRYGIDLPNGTGTIEKSLSFVYSQIIGGVEHYVLMQGTKANETTIEVNNNGSVEATMTLWAQRVTVPATSHGLGTPVWPANPTATQWTNVDPGTNPFVHNSLPYDVESFRVTVNQNLERIKPTGAARTVYIDSTNRRSDFEFTVWLKDTALQADSISFTPRDMLYKLSSVAQGSWAIQLQGAYIDAHEFGLQTAATEHQKISCSGPVKSVAMVNY